MGNYQIDLCPVVNRHTGISKSVESLPAVRGYEVPLQPTSCELVPFVGWKIPLKKPGVCSEVQELRWEQKTSVLNTGFGPTQQVTDYWIFSCWPPHGLFEGTCTECFPRAAVVHLVGNLGFNGGTEVTYGRRLAWRVHRNDLPFPGEAIFALAFITDGEGDAFIAKGSCAAPRCGTPGGDCMWWRDVSLLTSGMYLVVASNFFATPTWTGGFLTDYYTDTLGWANVPAGNPVFPDCSVYGDETLIYRITIEGISTKIYASDFAGYGIGTFVPVKKLGVKYNEPFSDSCLGIGTDPPEQAINNEIIGIGVNNQANPPLSCLSTLPIDTEAPPTVSSAYYTYTVGGGWVEHVMTVNLDSNGSCSGDCVGGKLNMLSGCWSQDIVWTHAPGGHTVRDPINIVCTYVKRLELALEGQNGLLIMPWHVMGMGG